MNDSRIWEISTSDRGHSSRRHSSSATSAERRDRDDEIGKTRRNDENFINLAFDFIFRFEIRSVCDGPSDGA